ncbi:MAG TPA: MFS transporter [Nocardioides sp.]|uniref:MFS transporter n=1 Tax=Nocardioides sp. TaxID=35761 RepID=UPI002C4B7991|nr:MFS transporter [Nocardioides sp.]HTW15312.1 MFS transporter [Nocardioides sp.]
MRPLGLLRSPRGQVLVLALACLVGVMAQASLIPLVAELPALFGVTGEDAAWAVTVTMIVAAVATPVSGALGDRFGRRRVLLWSSALATLGSVVCALADAYPLLVAGRSLQGVSTAMIPTAISLLYQSTSGTSLQRGSAVLSATMGIGTALGVTSSALVAQVADWHLVFWAVGVVGAMTTVAVAVAVPPTRDRPEAGPSFDWVGAGALSVGLVLSLLALTHVSTWTAARAGGTAAAGLVVLGLWARHQLVREHPLVDLRSAARRAMVVVNLVAVLAGVVMFTHVVALPQLLQDPRWSGWTVLQAGLCLVPAGLAMMLAASLSGPFVAGWGNRVSLAAGLAVAGAGYAVSALSVQRPLVLVGASVVVGAGIGLSFAVLPGAVMALAPAAQVGAANGLNTLARQVGASTASAVSGGLIAMEGLGTYGGYPWVYLFGAVCAGAGALAALAAD